MSRSYHVTRKQADKAMDSGDLDPMWQASEKAWVKKATQNKRELGKALPGRAGMPNRTIVSLEKERTAKAKRGSNLPGMLDRMLAAKETPNSQGGANER